MRQKLNFLKDVRHVTSGVKLIQHFNEKNNIPRVKQGGYSIMVQAVLLLQGTGQLSVTDGTMNSVLYQKILKDNVKPTVCELKLTQVHL